MPDNLQFDRVEPTSGAPTATVACTACGRPLPDTYYVVNGSIVCEGCRRAVEADWNRGGSAGRLGKAIGLGVLATIACSIVWYAVLELTDSQWGILAVVVGFVVGGAVRKGSNGRGGWRYQALAIFLTYTAIVSSYIPYMIEGARARSAELAQATSDSTALAQDSTTATAKSSTEKIGPLGLAIGIVVAFGFLFALPFLMGIQNIIGILIIGFALYQAWKLNRRMELRVSGPHQVSTSGATA